MTPKTSTALAPKEVTMLGEWYTVRNAVGVDIMASMSRMEINEPKTAQRYVSNRGERWRNSVNGMTGRGS